MIGTLQSLTLSVKNACRKYPYISTAILFGSVFIFISFCLGWYSLRVIPSNHANLANYPLELHNPFNILAKWDSRFYLSIARFGYLEQTHTAFFPLYPLTIRAVTLLGFSPLTSAVLLSWGCLIGAYYFYLKTTSLLFKNKALPLLQNILLFALYPASVFLLAVYTESLFALLSLGSIYFVLRKRYYLAATLAALTCTTRLNGLFVLALLAIMMYEHKEPIRKIIVFSAVSIIPLLCYMGYLWQSFGSPVQFLIAEKSWGRFGGSYISTLGSSITIFSAIGFILLVLTLIYWVRRHRWSFSIYTFLYILTPIASGNFDGLSRYIFMVFPLHWMVLAIIKSRPYLAMPIIATYSILWSYFLIQFVGGYTGG